ncbi:hypothetical protein BT63DRAFT_450507 [Microthyrium microscopicum]|uniref:Uncharacterized protein n=1 Tax=Microthyrium microscopicum TaxID=703497 RepID=A0A6A6UT55_9PEZI|nr:hypothetical protein BT63DRAFT_450507 [Microthyrium microscopicum]
MAVARRNIFTGLQILSIAQSSWDCAYRSMTLNSKWRNMEEWRRMKYPFTNSGIAKMEKCVMAGLKDVLRQELSIYQADEDGNFPAIQQTGSHLPGLFVKAISPTDGFELFWSIDCHGTANPSSPASVGAIGR